MCLVFYSIHVCCLGLLIAKKTFKKTNQLNATLVSAAANAAAFMAELGKNGNKHAKWNKICDRFATYCDHGAGALVAAFAGVILMLLISAVSISRLLLNSKRFSTAAAAASPSYLAAVP